MPAQTPETMPVPEEKTTDRVILISYPKVVFMYPLALYSLFAGIYLHILGDNPLDVANPHAVILAVAFLVVFTVNLAVFSFDFPRATSLTLFLFIAALLLGATLIFTLKPEWLPTFSKFFRSFHPLANSTFYYFVAGILFSILIIVRVLVHFDYWEVRQNELLHHHGLLSDLKRYPSPNLRVDKEINDVFEYVLLRSGRLILQPSGESRAIVLDNVPFITSKEQRITKMLGALQVQLRPANGREE